LRTSRSGPTPSTRSTRTARLLDSCRGDAQDLGLHLSHAQRLHPNKRVGAFTTDDLVAFVTQRNWDSPRWASATARNHRVALQSLFGWAQDAERIPIDPAWRLGQLVRIRHVRLPRRQPTQGPSTHVFVHDSTLIARSRGVMTRHATSWTRVPAMSAGGV
jgi:hypothetical protein